MNEYRISDLYYAAYLIVAGCVLKRTEKQVKQVFFIFDYQPILEDLRLDYYSEQGKVSALKHANQIKSLKALVHQVLTSS